MLGKSQITARDNLYWIFHKIPGLSPGKSGACLFSFQIFTKLPLLMLFNLSVKSRVSTLSFLPNSIRHRLMLPLSLPLLRETRNH